MTENKPIMNRKKMNLEKSKDFSLLKKKENRMKSKKLKQMMKKRLIVRNLSFKVSEEQLKEIFSEFGEVLEVNIPENGAGRKRGFAFVQFKDSKSQIKAMKTLNFKEICGRPIALDFAVDKTTYQCQQKNKKSASEPLKRDMLLNESKSDSESDSEDAVKKPEVNSLERGSSSDDETEEEGNGVQQFLKEFNADKEENLENEINNESSDDSDIDDNESHHCSEDDEVMETKPNKRNRSDDVSEGKTVFIQNVSFKNTEEDLQEVMQEYGDIDYCLLCTDPITDYPKGTAFVKFKEKESATKLVAESAKEPGIILDGRKLMCNCALSREELSKKFNGFQKIKDKRNLSLLKCGLIMQGYEESEGVSHTDMAKRAQLEIIKKQKLKNVNFFVSDKRLAVHNLPKNITDKDLYVLFKKAAGKEAVIKEARVMKDLKKTDSKGIPVSRGFGFVSFTENEHALKALTELNNNPKIFTSTKRPIVEFSIENKMALLSKERRKEKLKLLHKKKIEEKMNNKQTEESNNQRGVLSYPIHLKRKKKRNETNNSINKKKRRQSSVSNHLSDETQDTKHEKKQKKNPRNKRRKGKVMNTQEKNSLSVLTNKYKQKLLNKFS